MQDLGSKRLIRMFSQAAMAIDAQRDHLSDLDGAIADADHGMTMSLGFRAVTSALAKLGAEASPSDVFRTAAGAFLDAVGASTGPLYASGFLNAAKHLDGLDAVDPAAMLEGIASGIAARGKGSRGEKTMLDVWLPAAEAAQQATRENPAELWTYVRQAASDGAESTRTMIAVRGRAARVGERSIGHIDPGAVSALLIVGAMADTFGDADLAI
ncbi:dihydroxyacetone kinase subunit L [Tianweitania sp. BSSL-BM11]|uniref:Dihydroxyacetone kinase subunit L n=1 Tax=Tianweitania aestuarii TaxID=2814886 RepID=A0ABS5RRL8_9HYPH|nr:dihydroxyacetone kinase subunit DhaL [Tianweitania aestuarii]MBS9719629.1 dihydroxyacetone kinase subunit L [Tianweitania aestuarii]